MSRIKLDCRSHTEVIRESDPDDRWSGEYTETDVLYFNETFEVVKDNQFYDVTVAGEPEIGEILYLLVVTYSTGDSFSHHTGLREYVGMYRDENTAWRNLSRIKSNKRANPITLLDETEGEIVEYQMYVPWVGYFESLTDIEVRPLIREK